MKHNNGIVFWVGTVLSLVLAATAVCASDPVLDSKPDDRNPGALVAIGRSILHDGGAQSSVDKAPDQLRAALSYFHRALEIDPKHRDALASLAYGNLQLAEKLNSQGGYTWRSRTKVAPYLDAAVRYSERLLRLEPRSSRMREVLMNTYLQTGQVAKYVTLRGKKPRGTFTYFEPGRVVSKPLSELRRTEQEALAGGHMPWRDDPAQVAAAFIYYGLTSDHRTRAEEKQVPHGKWVDLKIDRPGEHTTIRTTRVRGKTATVQIFTDDVLDATVQLQQPLGVWWYVTSFQFAH